MTEELSETLAMVAQAAAASDDEWWIIGSAAVMLHGADIPHVKDVDLLMSARDADSLLKRVGGERRRTETSDHFRSLVFGVWTEPPIPVEVFGGFSFAKEGVWREVSLITRETLVVAGSRVFVPSVDELARLLQSFGRPKDLERSDFLKR